MKHKTMKALLLSALMINAPLADAMEEDKALIPHPQKICNAEVPFLQLPEDIFEAIFRFVPDVRDFFAFMQTCKTAHAIGKRDRFYLPQNPAELLKLLACTIDFKKEKFHFDQIIPLVARMQRAGDLFFQAGTSYFGSDCKPYSPTDLNLFGGEKPTEEQLKQWQVHGLALALAEHTNGFGARHRRDLLKTSPVLPDLDDKVFFHLLPRDRPPLSSAKLQYSFLNFVRDVEATRENAFLYYDTQRAYSPSFNNALSYIQDILRQMKMPRAADPKEQDLVPFFQKKEIRLLEKQVALLQMFFENKREKITSLEPGERKDRLKMETVALQNTLSETIMNAENTSFDLVNQAKSPAEQEKYILKMVALYEQTDPQKIAN